jgi:hypothetical protein
MHREIHDHRSIMTRSTNDDGSDDIDDDDRR